jgi:hypothetical protein
MNLCDRRNLINFFDCISLVEKGFILLFLHILSLYKKSFFTYEIKRKNYYNQGMCKVAHLTLTPSANHIFLIYTLEEE